jgi:probable F420-dependent oxidoreductase
VELGIQGLNSLTRFDATLPLARLAEELGYGSWWAQDHVVLPTTAGSPIDPATPIVDPIVHLAHVAAVTRWMTLGTAVIILPQRNPLVLAKQAASLDVLSGGRFVLGVGAGWLVAEMVAVGVDPAGRGERTDEYLDAMTALWTEPAPEFHGRHVDFSGVDAPTAERYPGGRRRPQPGGPSAGGQPRPRLLRQRDPGGDRRGPRRAAPRRR